ncbi:MAG: alkaline phosphatase family protein, partial [Clostridia bacterium]|nr:alkaline phosphatase family protein [Clostridia bacterium]
MYTYKRVALIGVDGAGNFFRQAQTPNLDRIFENGAAAYDVYTSIPSISAECWGAMLHGVTPDLHRLTNGIASSVPYDPESLFPSVFRIIRENDPDCELASFCNWNPINYGIIENGLGVHKDTASDGPLCDKICDYLAEHDPKFLFVQFDEVDGAGHGHGYGTEKHLQQITITDGYIARIWEMYEKRGFADDTLFIVTADHGGFGHSHGGITEEEMRVMFAL